MSLPTHNTTWITGARSIYVHGHLGIHNTASVRPPTQRLFISALHPNMDTTSDREMCATSTRSGDSDTEKFSTPHNSGINPERASSIARGCPSSTQSYSALEASPTISPSPFAFYPSMNLAKKNIRGKKNDKSEPLERRTRSQSRQRPRSEEDVGPAKKQRNVNTSDHELPDQTTANYISMLADQVATKLNEKMDRSNFEMCENLNCIQTGQEELKTVFEAFANRISLVENKVQKIESDFNERLLQVENASIGLTEKYSNLMKTMEKVQNFNNQLAKNVDDLTQEKLNFNKFVTGLTPAQREPNGFLQFARETLKIDAQADDFRAIFPVPTKTEPILKIISKDMPTRIKYFASRRELTNNKNVWLREDLTKPRQHLAWLARKTVGKDGFVRTWTSFGTVLLSRGLGTKPLRIDNPGYIPGVPLE